MNEISLALNGAIDSAFVFLRYWRHFSSRQGRICRGRDSRDLLVSTTHPPVSIEELLELPLAGRYYRTTKASTATLAITSQLAQQSA